MEHDALVAACRDMYFSGMSYKNAAHKHGVTVAGLRRFWDNEMDASDLFGDENHENDEINENDGKHHHSADDDDDGKEGKRATTK